MIPPTIAWDSGAVVIIDQTLLPGRLEMLRITDVDDLVGAITRLAVRGAPALGAAGALGVALAASNAGRDGLGAEAVKAAADRLRNARPTAVNLAWGIDRALSRLSDGPGAVLAEAQAVLIEDVEANHRIGERGADYLAFRRASGLRLLTHCNAGSLACVEWGTAVGVIRACQRRGILANVIATETRPLLQGSRLTAWELGRLGIEHRVVVDSAAAGLIAGGHVDAVVVGADRIAANWDVANKVGTLGLALASAHAGIPFLVAAPESTIDPLTADGASIVIEMRDESEVLEVRGTRIAPDGCHALNPAFDVTPAALISAITTERRLIVPSTTVTAVAG